MTLQEVMIGEFPVDILIPALCAGLLVIATHVPLGTQVLQRGIIFIDLAIAQVAGLGAYLVTMLLGKDAAVIWIQCGAVCLALLAPWLLVATERLSSRYQEPVIGIVFALAATAVILLLSKDPQGGQHLSDLLAGQILWISHSQIYYSALATAALLAALYFLRGRGGAFYSLFAVAITVSVQLVGVYLVFATLIIPALSTVTIRTPRTRLLASYGTAAVGYMLGLTGSALFDLPTGPLIVWTLAATGLFSCFLSRYFVDWKAGVQTSDR
jgi:zinc/manganese transport system permease protein